MPVRKSLVKTASAVLALMGILLVSNLLITFEYFEDKPALNIINRQERKYDKGTKSRPTNYNPEMVGEGKTDTENKSNPPKASHMGVHEHGKNVTESKPRLDKTSNKTAQERKKVSETKPTPTKPSPKISEDSKYGLKTSQKQTTILQTNFALKLSTEAKITGWLVNTSSCRIPEYDPWDSSIDSVIKKEKPFKGCSGGFAVELRQSGNTLTMRLDGAAAGGACRAECCYRSVERDREGRSDNAYKFGENSTCFDGKSAVVVQEEFVHVKCFCTMTNATIHEDFRAFIVPKMKAQAASESTHGNNGPVSVYIIGIDSVSAQNFKRFLPGVDKFLNEQFDAIWMHGLTKVGVNTYPNLLAFLSGIDIGQVYKSLQKGPFDTFPLVWKHFSNLSYATMFNEDDPSISAFNYLKKGFYNTPTDYYLRPMYRAISDSKYVKNSRTGSCINGRHHIDFQLQWLEDFMSQVDGPQFSFLFSSTLTHQGPLTYVKALEPRLLQFFKRYRNSPRYNTSILFFFGDHGMRFGSVMKSELGRHESRLPFFRVILPPWYAARYPERVKNLRLNSHRLTTFFDAHATLREILQDAGATTLPRFTNNGISLFSEVPPNRTCEAAQIPAHWCVCRSRRPVATELAVVRMAAEAVVRHINSHELREVRGLCAELRLRTVTAAHHALSEEGHHEKDTYYDVKPFEEFLVQLVTSPGDAEFEATVRCSPSVRTRGGVGSTSAHAATTVSSVARPEATTEGAEEPWAVVSCNASQPLIVMGVSRLNLYRGQSDCLVDRFDEKRFCYCKNLL